MDAGKLLYFGDTDRGCLGVLRLRMPLAGNIVNRRKVHFAPISVSLSFEPDALQRPEIMVNFGNGSHPFRNDNWSLQIVFNCGRTCKKWPQSVWYKEAEIRWSYEHSWHTSTYKLKASTQQRVGDHAMSGKRSQVTHIDGTRDTFHRLITNQNCFCVSISKENCLSTKQ